MSLSELEPFKDNGILFWGNFIRDPNTKTADIGVQLHAEQAARDIFVERMLLETPNLTTERVINKSVKIDRPEKNGNFFFKRYMPFKSISDDSIPLTADKFTLLVDYRIEEGASKQMTITFDNASFLGPVL